jgi:hypothetical protein
LSHIYLLLSIKALYTVYYGKLLKSTVGKIAKKPKKYKRYKKGNIVAQYGSSGIQTH